MDSTPATKVSLIIPAYNEAGSIGHTLDEAKGYFEDRHLDYEIVVAADGDDGTRELVSARNDPRIRVIGGPERLGKGRGIRQAVALSTGTVVGFADADNKTPITELDKFLPLFEQGHDVVIGSRGMGESRIERRQPWFRRVGSRGFAVVMHAITGLRHIPDTQCGFKFFSRAAAQDLFGRQKVDGYMFDVEILYLATRAGYRLAQVPVRWRDDGDSRLRLISGNLRNIYDVARVPLMHGRRRPAQSEGEACEPETRNSTPEPKPETRNSNDLRPET